MRKTSQDGGDSTSITSGIENEIKKPGAIMKTKRNSLKRKVQNFSLESDDAVIEPLLQKDKEKTDAAKQSAKFNLMSKNKTETNSEKRTDKDKLMSDDKLQKAVLSNTSDVTDRILPTSSGKENLMSKSSSNAPLHNHMNTNMFSNHDGLKTYVAPKSQILVEIDGSKHVGYNPSPLIFTTAKIHTDGKTKHMEPVQMTPVPILSTIEVSMKNGMNTGETSGHVTSNISAVYIPQSNKHVREQDPKPPNTTVSNTTTSQNKVADLKIQILNDKIDGKSNSIDKSSMASSSNKEIKFTQPNIATDSVKDNFTSNKSLQNKTESQPSSSTSEKDKTIVPHEAKSVSNSIAFTKMANSSIKEAKTDKTDNWHSENKINLNETVKPEVLDLRRTKPSDHGNSFDKTSQDKLKDSANASFSNKQLQRQSIVLDKDDPMTKLKPNIVSPPKTNNSRGIHKCGESQKSSTIETNTLIDKTKVPKSSANSIQVTSVTSVSTDNNAYKAADNKIYASTTTAVTLNNKPSPITSNIAINQTVASAINSAVTNNPTTTTSTVKNTSAVTNEVAVSTTTPAVMDNKSSVPINTPVIANKTSTTNIVAPTKISGLSTITTNNKISSAVTSTATGNKLPSTSTPANKISNPMTTSAATNKMSSPSTAVSTSTKTSSPATPASNKISSSSSTNTTSNKISSPSSTNTASNKLCNPITMTSATNKISAVTSTINAASNKISPSSPTTTTGYKITDKPSSTTTADSKVPKPATTTATAVINKISAPSTTGVTTSKTSTASSTTTSGSKVSLPSITSTAGSKVSSPSIATTAATKKIPNPVITTTAIKMTSGSTTTTTGVDKISTSNSNSSVPKTSSSSTLPQLSITSITKSAIITTPSVSNPMNTEHHSSNISKSSNIKSGIPNETFTTTATAANTKPLSTTTTTKPAKVTTVATPTTTSQHTTVVKSPTVTTAKSVPTKTKPQLAVGKSNAITPKSSSTSNEKPTTAKASTTSISSTTTTGVSNTTTTAAAVSSGSSPATTEAIKQSDSKSKVIGNGSKSFKA